MDKVKNKNQEKVNVLKQKLGEAPERNGWRSITVQIQNEPFEIISNGSFIGLVLRPDGSFKRRLILLSRDEAIEIKLKLETILSSDLLDTIEVLNINNKKSNNTLNW